MKTESNGKLSGDRLEIWARGKSELPVLRFPRGGRNGEALDTDEAAVWKRVLNYRLAAFLEPRTIVETHPGYGISTSLYRRAAPHARITAVKEILESRERVDLLDVDPFGQAWDTINDVIGMLSERGVIMVTSGEVQAVVRRWSRAQRFKTARFGRTTPAWVVKEYIPKLEELCAARAAFFYAFPTSVRVILSRRTLPRRLWHGCPQWMWWFKNAANQLDL